eukprot:TRINITY_DN32873_c0_g1_i2.p1 TRINITY_DN32873_c0_g1~~TRINITY_DN32873_c0_g1_i2.p1  ORF type:complete len:317 (-),score=22.29 TRINITY_DN32873_c0_g1_i2:374-1324(-)
MTTCLRSGMRASIQVPTSRSVNACRTVSHIGTLRARLPPVGSSSEPRWNCRLVVAAQLAGISLYRSKQRRSQALCRAGMPGTSETPSGPSYFTLARRGLLVVLFVGSWVLAGAGISFRSGQVEQSTKLYNIAAQMGFPSEFLWQHGVSLYYSGLYEEAAAQFRRDAEVKKTDPEESMWATACEARVSGLQAARQNMRPTSAVTSPKKELLTAHQLFKGEDELAAMAALQETAKCDGPEGLRAAFYLGLFEEARGESDKARSWIQRAANSEYCQTSQDFLASIVKVHAKVRGWRLQETSSNAAWDTLGWALIWLQQR